MHTNYEQTINTNEAKMEIDAKILEKFGILKNSKDVHSPSTLHEKIEAEKTIELAMIRSGIKRFHKTIIKARAKKAEKIDKDGQKVLKERETNESTTIYGQVLVQQGLEPLCEALNKYFNEAFDGHAKRYATEATLLAKCIPIKEVAIEEPIKPIKPIDIETNEKARKDYIKKQKDYISKKRAARDRWAGISFITLKAVLDSITVSSTQTKAVLKIAGAIEDEARLLYFKECDNRTYSRTKEWLKTKNNYRHKRRVFHYAMNRHQLEYTGWCKEEKVKLGKLLLELLAKTTGFIKLTKTFAVKGKSIIYVQATEKTMEWIKNKKIHAEILKPFREPMLVKPKRWDNNPYSGGYYIKDLRPTELSATVGDTNNPINQQSTNEVKNAL